MSAPPATALPARTTTATCTHCGSPVPASNDDGFCCRGCAEVHRLVRDAGLSRYYDLGGGEGHPVVRANVDRKWLEPILERHAATRGLSRIALDVQGVHCAGCVWLLEQLFKRRGGAGILVNPALGSVELTVTNDFALAGYVDDVEAFGYRLGPALKRESARANDLVWRMGVCIAIAMNTMIFGVAIYCGLTDGPVHRLFHALDLGLSLVSVLVGGSVFIRSALQALRRRVLHLDLPIALGILLVFASSTYTYATRGGSTSYFDTLNVFIALMLVGRFLQERVIAKNRALLLQSDGVEGLYTRRLDRDGKVRLTRCRDIAPGDQLVIAHQDLVPVDSVLVSAELASFSLDWISGESAPKAVRPGEIVPAGAFCQDTHATTVRAVTGFETSSVASLLRTSVRREDDMARATSWHRRLTRIYVAAVLALATLAAVAWLVATRDVARTLDVVAGVLIVTCPCAFGIATPLAYELAQARLRRVGLFVRTPGFLDRAAEVTRLVFDKTGTLTAGSLALVDPDAVSLLGVEHRRVLHALTVRSSHPKSRAILAAIEAAGEAAPFDATARVREVAGKGMELTHGGHVFRLGGPAWAVANAAVPSIVRGGDVVFSEDGAVLATFATREELRPDAAEEVAELQRAGYDVFVLSGDLPEATRAIGLACGVPEEHIYASRTPEGKAAWLASHETAKTLFVGDGINDSLVAEEAYCAGTPAIDRPFMASRCDFYFVTPGLRPIREALRTARAVARVVRTNLGIAVAYNTITVTLALAGLMTPLLCAVLMPVSSLTTVLATTVQLRRRTSWKS
jgi:Cu2+-exporting ATPase